MNEHLLFFEEAFAEIEAARRWYREQSELAERAFLGALDHAIDTIVAAPHRWPMHSAGTRRYVLPDFPYSVIYFVEAAIIIVAVAHDRRRPGYWRERLNS